MAKSRNKNLSDLLTDLPHHVNEALDLGQNVLAELVKLRRAVERLARSREEAAVAPLPPAPQVVAGVPEVATVVRDFVRACVKKREGRDVTTEELCAAYAQVATAKGWPVISLRRAQKLLPYAMLEVHGVSRTHNIPRKGRGCVRGYRHVAVVA